MSGNYKTFFAQNMVNICTTNMYEINEVAYIGELHALEVFYWHIMTRSVPRRHMCEIVHSRVLIFTYFLISATSVTKYNTYLKFI